MFQLCQRFCKYVCPIEVGVNLNDLQITILYVILETVPFEGNIFGSNFSAFTIGQNDT